MNDTSPGIQRKIREMMQKKSGAERVRMASDMFDASRRFVIASLAPGLDDIEMKLRLCQRLYGSEIDLGAFSAALHSWASTQNRTK